MTSTTPDSLPLFKETAISDIPRIIESARQYFQSGVTRSAEWRKKQLKGLLTFLEKEELALCTAMEKDLHRVDHNLSRIGDIMTTKTEVVDALDNLDEWMKPKKGQGPNVSHLPDTILVRSEPLGVCLIIGAWNYPVQLLLGPLSNAISAGNVAVLKPSEVSPHTAAVMTALLPKYIDPTAFQFVNGGVPETTALLTHKFDHIFYTGNGAVGKIIMAAAAKSLTPVVLELGGKSPVYVHGDTDVDTAAKRVYWGKTFNAGQTCVGVDYVMVKKTAMPKFVEALKKHHKSFFGENPKQSIGLPRIVNARHFDRLSKILDRQCALTHCQTVVGGDRDKTDNYIEPTAILNVKLDDPVMEDELFGPILPVIEVEDEDQAIHIVNSRDRPLALYIFSDDRTVINKIMDRTSSGGIAINDCVIQINMKDTPFGGVGPSGMGNYHGEYGFNTFSHQRTMLWRPSGLEFLNDIRYYPKFGEKDTAKMLKLITPAPKSDFSKALGSVARSNATKAVLILGVGIALGIAIAVAAKIH